MKRSLSGGSVNTWNSGNFTTIKLHSICLISSTQIIKININTCFTALLYFSRARKIEEFALPNPIQGHSPKTTKLEGKKDYKIQNASQCLYQVSNQKKEGESVQREIERYKRQFGLTTELRTDILCPNKHKWQNNLFGHSFPKNFAVMQLNVVAN